MINNKIFTKKRKGKIININKKKRYINYQKKRKQKRKQKKFKKYLKYSNYYDNQYYTNKILRYKNNSKKIIQNKEFSLIDNICLYPYILIIDNLSIINLPIIYQKILNDLLYIEFKANNIYNKQIQVKNLYTKYNFFKKEYNKFKKKLISKKNNSNNIVLKLIFEYYIYIIDNIITKLNNIIYHNQLNYKIKLVNLYYNFSESNKIKTYNFILDKKIKIILKIKLNF